MKARTMIPALATLVLVAACESSTAPEADAVITGEVEETSETPSSAMEPSWSLLGSTGSASATASTVVAARVRSNGSLEILSEAEVGADGRYTISGVPSGQSNLVVAARSSAGAEVGRVIVRARTQTAAEVRAAPINARTTAEGLVYARLRASGMSAAAINTAELALLLRMDASTAAEVSASSQAIDAVAAAYVAAQEAMTRAFASAESEVSVAARADFLAAAAAMRDRDRHGGMSASAAHEAFVQASFDAYLAAGVSAEALVLAMAAAASELEHALADAQASARFDIARQATRLNVEARQRLAAELPAAFSVYRAIAVSANTSTTLRIGTSLSFGGFVTAVREEEEAAEAAVTTAIMAGFTTLSAAVRAEAEARLEAAFVAATLSARVDASASASQKAQAIAEYRQEVRAAVDAFVETLPSEVRLDAEATVKLLIAVRGGPSFS